MAAKRSSLFGAAPIKATDAIIEPLPATAAIPTLTEAAPSLRYQKAKTREGKRVATVYLEREALRQLQKIAFDEEVTIQALLVEGVNAVFQARGLSRIA